MLLRMEEGIAVSMIRPTANIFIGTNFEIMMKKQLLAENDLITR